MVVVMFVPVSVLVLVFVFVFVLVSMLMSMFMAMALVLAMLLLHSSAFFLTAKVQTLLCNPVAKSARIAKRLTVSDL